jgi:menaquinone-9 beta-reductase
MEQHWDVIIVGARCSGAALGMLLAREGRKVLLLEAAPRGTDMPLSTHFVQPCGMDVLDELGIGDKLREVAPATRTLVLDLDGAAVAASFPDRRAGYCVRRMHLDTWLQERAERDGVTLRDRHCVVDLVRTGDRVSGVVVRTPTGTETLHANLVVGADGRHSTLAKLTAVEEYLSAESTRGGYWAYYPAPRNWSNDWDAYVGHEGETLRYVFRADGGLVLLVVAEPLAVAERWGKDYRTKLHERLLAGRDTRALVAGKEPVGRVLGLLKTRFFYRRPIGPGFALVGDAGHYKDFVTGQGITDALLDAKRLSCAIADGSELAFQRFWRERDVATMPLHFDALQQGRVGFNSPFNRFIFENLAKRPDLTARAALVADRRITPSEMLSMKTLLPWMFGALVRGRFDVLRGFMGAGREIGEQARELAQRQKLLRDLETRAARVVEGSIAPAARPSTSVVAA